MTAPYVEVLDVRRPDGSTRTFPARQGVARTHQWLFHNGTDTGIMSGRIGCVTYELRPGEGLTRCARLSTIEKPLIGTDDASLIDCSECASA